MNNINVEIKMKKELTEAGLKPKKGSKFAAAFDVHYPKKETLTMKKGDVATIDLGFGLNMMNKDDVNASMVVYMMPRSGLGSKGLYILNTIGVIDQDYQGNLIAKVLWDPKENEDAELTVNFGERFLQMIFSPVLNVNLEEVDDFSSESVRGAGGFGSTKM